MRIIHLSDIHWRGLTRHDEYKRAFSKMFEDLKEIKPDRIIICGDIVHSKTQGISPELIDHLTWWFRSMADICEVDVTLGNHDGNLTNVQRQDAISPIVNAINDRRIHLYKQSGVYQLKKGVNLCVFSIFDKDGWDRVKPVDGDINIATFHGSVAGSQTDVGWTLESEMDVAFFKKFTIALLGDIHAKQFLDYRDGKPWIGYSGSAIQQDYGENPGKGYLIWNIKSSSDFNVEFKQVEHDSEFRTIEWKGSIKQTIDEAKKLSRGSRVRIRSTDLIPQLEIRQLTNELTKLYGMSEVVFKDEHVIDSNIISTENAAIEKHSLRDLEVVLKLLRDYFGPETLSTQEWMVVKSLIKNYMAKITNEDSIVRNSKWHVNELWFENTFGYGSDNYINFKDMFGITGVFGPNRVGKSSIIGTILYTLFNGTDRGSIKNLHIINTRKGHCRSKLTFSVEGKQYMVERQSVKHEARGLQYAVTNLNLFEIDQQGNVIRELNGEQRTDTEKTLRNLVGTIEDVMLTGVAAQGDMNKFIDAGSSYRDQVMSRFLDLVFFEKMAQYAKEDSSLIKAEVKNSPDKDWDTLIKTRKDELQRQAAEILRLEKALKEKRLILDGLKVQLATQFSENSITQVDVDKLSRKIDVLREKLESLNATKVKSTIALQQLVSDAADVKEAIAGTAIDELKKSLKTIHTLKDTLGELRQKHEKEKQVLANQEKSIKRLLEVPCGDSFPSCKYIKDSHNDKLKIVSQQTITNELLEKIKSAELSLADLRVESIEKQITKYDLLIKSESSFDIKIIKAKQSVIDCDREIERNQKDLTAAEMLLIDYISRVVDDDDDGPATLKREISDIETVIDDLDTKRVKAASRQGSLTTEIKKLNEEKERYSVLKSQWYVYEMFIQAMSKKGIPSQIIHAQLPVINAEISRILQGVVDYTLKFEKDDESNTTEIYIDYGDSKRLIELGSGMEKMISSLAIRVALQNASSLPHPDFIVIDEGFGTLDETNIDACNRLLISLKRFFKNIIVISHIDGVKDVTDNSVDVTRVGADSKVVFN